MKSNKSNILEKLKVERSNNILQLVKWSLSDFIEMEETYNKAKEAILESSDSEIVAILEEKLSQLQEALRLKKEKELEINL